MHVEQYYQEKKNTLSQGSLRVHQAVLSKALKAAASQRKVSENVASLAMNNPSDLGSAASAENVWTFEQASRFLTAVKGTKSVQFIALFTLALDTGLRKGELLGLKWQDIDFETRKLRVERQLLGKGEKGLVFSPPKRGAVRTVKVSAETLAALKEHKRVQSEVKMKNRLYYEDNGLMFAQDWEQQTSGRAVLGGPLHRRSIDLRLERVCKDAKVKQISVHDLRHTCATLMIEDGVSPKLVQERLGHKKIDMTLGIYSHVLPTMEEDAVSRLAKKLHGG